MSCLTRAIVMALSAFLANDKTSVTECGTGSPEVIKAALVTSYSKLSRKFLAASICLVALRPFANIPYRKAIIKKLINMLISITVSIFASLNVVNADFHLQFKNWLVAF